MQRRLRFVVTGLALTALATACGGNADEKYSTPPQQKYSGQRKATLPAIPTPPTTPIKNEAAQAFTVYGATHHFRSPNHAKEVTAASIAIVGYIVETNYDKAPECAQHEQGKADKEPCTATEVPSFRIADNKGDTKGAKIRVINWAHNFAAIFDAMKAYDKMKDPKDPPKVADKVTGQELPFPLPALGAKVKVTGKYGLMGTNAGSEKIADPLNGVMMMEKIETLEPAPEKAAFAAVAPKKKT